MNRNEMVKAIATKEGLTAKDTEKVIRAFEEITTETLKKGEKVSLTGFLTFETKEIEAREGRNPKTGEAITIEAHKKVSVKIGKSLKQEIR